MKYFLTIILIITLCLFLIPQQSYSHDHHQYICPFNYSCPPVLIYPPIKPKPYYNPHQFRPYRPDTNIKIELRRDNAITIILRCR